MSSDRPAIPRSGSCMRCAARHSPHFRGPRGRSLRQVRRSARHPPGGHGTTNSDRHDDGISGSGGIPSGTRPRMQTFSDACPNVSSDVGPASRSSAPGRTHPVPSEGRGHGVPPPPRRHCISPGCGSSRRCQAARRERGRIRDPKERFDHHVLSAPAVGDAADDVVAFVVRPASSTVGRGTLRSGPPSRSTASDRPVASASMTSRGFPDPKLSSVACSTKGAEPEGAILSSAPWPPYLAAWRSPHRMGRSTCRTHRTARRHGPGEDRVGRVTSERRHSVGRRAFGDPGRIPHSPGRRRHPVAGRAAPICASRPLGWLPARHDRGGKFPVVRSLPIALTGMA